MFLGVIKTSFLILNLLDYNAAPFYLEKSLLRVSGLLHLLLVQYVLSSLVHMAAWLAFGFLGIC